MSEKSHQSENGFKSRKQIEVEKEAWRSVNALMENERKNFKLTLEKMDKALAEMDKAIAENDRIIAELNKAIAEKDRIITELRKKLKEKNQ